MSKSRWRPTLTTTPPSAHVVVLSLLLGGLIAPATFADDRSWATLSKLRTTLEARSPVAVDFLQSLVPAGFGPEDGEVESGKLAINLPACLRWDYLGDFEKSFLLCDNEGYYWNPGESVGQLFSLEGKEEAPGLDFFLQSTAKLKERYQATSALEGDTVAIDLVPHTPTEDVVALRLVVEQASGLLRSMSYDDIDGNRTTFKLENYVDGAARSLFAPPNGVSWESQ